MRIPGDFGIVSPAHQDGKPCGTDRAHKGRESGRLDVVEFSSSGRRLSADFAPKRTGTTLKDDGLDTGARESVEQRLASGYYERIEVLEVVAGKLLEQLGM